MKFEQAFELVSTNTKHGDDSKCQETDTQSLKSEISTEGNQSTITEMDITKRNMNHLSSAEDGLLNTESSSSNSLSAVFRASISNHSCQETSIDAYSFKNRGSSIDSSNSKVFDLSLEEMVTGSYESGLSAQIARKAMRNARTRNRMKITSTAENENSSMINQKGDFGILSSVSSDDFCADESLEYPMKKPRKVAMGFDLNEDINTNNIGDCIKPCHNSVIHVVAKAGILRGRPVIPLKFEGRLGWKGSAEASAFRPVSESYRKTRFTGIDLNVAAAAAFEDVISSSPSVFQDPEKQGKSNSLWIDLNCLYNAADDFTLPKTEEHYSPLIDLNLGNDKPAFDYSNNGYLADLSTMQHCGPKLPLVSQSDTFAPPFQFHSVDPLPAGVLPYARFSYEQGILPRILNSGPLHTSFDGWHVVKTEDKLSARIDETRDFSFLAKRKETEGGLGCYYKHEN